LVFLPARPIRARADIEDLGDLGGLVWRGAQGTSAVCRTPADVLGATLQILAQAGFCSLNFHGVASQAGISTRFDRADLELELDLVVDAIRAAIAQHPVPDTGSFQGDWPGLPPRAGPRASRHRERAR